MKRYIELLVMGVCLGLGAPAVGQGAAGGTGAAGARAAPTMRRVPTSEVPITVTGAVEQRYPDARVRAVQRGTTSEGVVLYEVAVDAPDGAVSLAIAPDGTILLEQQELAVSALPPTITAGLESSRYRDWKVIHAARLSSGRETGVPPVYELHLEGANNGAKKTAQVAMDSAGNITRERQAPPAARGKRPRPDQPELETQ